MVVQIGSREHQHLRVFSSSWGQKKGDGELQAKDIKGAVGYMCMFVFTLVCEIHHMHCTDCFVEEFG